MSTAEQALAEYERESRRFAGLASSTEETFYPLVRNLLSVTLQEHGLPFEVRTGTSEQRRSQGRDRPDFVLSDAGLLVSAFGEVKPPDQEIAAMAISEERNDQIGRYLAQTGVVILCNVRSIGVLACRPGFDRSRAGRVPPADRELINQIPLWPSGGASVKETADRLGKLIERSVIDFAPIADPATLARILARQAKDARNALPHDLSSLENLLSDYKAALGLTFELDDPKGDSFFRSTLIQTAFYSLFAAWALWQRAAESEAFSWDRAHRYLHIPFLTALFHEFRHPIRIAKLGLEPHLDRATATLGRVDLALFRSRMTFPTAEDDDATTTAMTYFYEPFIEAFDPELKKDMGVWYTPPEVVRYQVRRAHQLLKVELGCRHGLADDKVVILDPCCGTGAYLLEACRCIAAELRRTGDEAMIGITLLRALTNRVLGFEILTAPFAIAQLQLYVMLSELGAPPPNDQRLSVMLTNALSGWRERRQLRLNFPELQEEHDAAQKLKHEAEIIVIVGNPPYDRHAGVAIDEEADLVDHYKGIARVVRKKPDGSTEFVQDGPSLLFKRFGIRKMLLDDLYVRFFRLAEHRIGEVSKIGVVSLISNSSWLTGRSHPIMRESLLGNFHEVWIDNLNGDKYRTGKLIPKGLPGAGSADQSIFSTALDARGIQTGTAIATFLKRPTPPTHPDETIVHYRDFWGRADEKRTALLSSLSNDTTGHLSPSYEDIQPTERNWWRLSPHEETIEYGRWPSIGDLFPAKFQGVNPNRGISGSLIDGNRDRLAKRMQAYYQATKYDVVEKIAPELAKKRSRYNPQGVWTALRRNSVYSGERLKPYLLFPLDQRWIYYETEHKLLNERRPEFWENLSDNEFLVTVPAPRKLSEAKPLFARTLVDLHAHDRGSVCIPAMILPRTIVNRATANLAPPAWPAIRAAWGLKGGLDGNDARKAVRVLFNCALAVLHAPAFGEEHRSALSAAWARIPVPSSAKVAQRLQDLGQSVARLLDASKHPEDLIERVLGEVNVTRIGALTRVDGEPIRERDLQVSISYFGPAKGRYVVRSGELIAGERVGDLFISRDVFFGNVPQCAWEFELGGYPVLRKWLGYRHSKKLSGESLHRKRPAEAVQAAG